MFGFKKKKASGIVASEAERAVNGMEVAEIAAAPICPIPPRSQMSINNNAPLDRRDEYAGPADVDAPAQLAPETAADPEPASTSGPMPPRAADDAAAAGLASPGQLFQGLQLFQDLKANIHTVLYDGASGGQTWSFSGIRHCLAENCDAVEELKTDDRDKDRILVARDRVTGLLFGALMKTDGTPDNISEIIFICIFDGVPDPKQQAERLSYLLEVSAVIEEDGKILIAARPIVKDAFSGDLFSRQIALFLADLNVALVAMASWGEGQSMYAALAHFFDNDSLDPDHLQNTYTDGGFVRPGMLGQARDGGDLSDDPHDDIGEIGDEVLVAHGGPTASFADGNDNSVDGSESEDYDGAGHGSHGGSMPYFAPEEDCPKCRGTGRRFILSCRECDGTGVL